MCWVYFLHHCYKVAASTELILQPYSKSRTKDMLLSLKSGTLSRCLLAPADFLLDNDALKPVCTRRWKLIITFSRLFELIAKCHHPRNWLWWECLYTPWHTANATNQDIFSPRRVVYQHTIAFKYYKSEQDDTATPILRESWKMSVCHFQPLSREGDFPGWQGKGELGK